LQPQEENGLLNDRVVSSTQEGLHSTITYSFELGAATLGGTTTLKSIAGCLQ